MMRKDKYLSIKNISLVRKNNYIKLPPIQPAMRDTFWHQGWKISSLCHQRIHSSQFKGIEIMLKRHVVTIIVDDINEAFQPVSDLLHANAQHILLRVGYPMRDWGASVIFLIMELTTERMGAFSGKLGMINGVRVKTQTLKIERGDKNED
jgi:putative iron-only hydrogenase system regulator